MPESPAPVGPCLRNTRDLARTAGTALPSTVASATPVSEGTRNPSAAQAQARAPAAPTRHLDREREASKEKQGNRYIKYIGDTNQQLVMELMVMMVMMVMMVTIAMMTKMMTGMNKKLMITVMMRMMVVIVMMVVTVVMVMVMMMMIVAKVTVSVMVMRSVMKAAMMQRDACV